MPKRLDLNTGRESLPKRRLDLPTEPLVEPLVELKAERPVRKPLFDQDPNTLTHSRITRPKTPTDYLIDRILLIDPNIDPARLRGRIDILLTGNNETLLGWGEANLAPMRVASDIQARIAADMAKIDPVSILSQAHDAMTKRNVFGFGKKPEYYEQLLPQIRNQLTALMLNTEREYRTFIPEIADLNLDVATLNVTIGEYQDAITLNIANARLKTLLMAQQTGLMLMKMLENTIAQCLQYSEQIDTFLTVTIPQWKMSNG